MSANRIQVYTEEHFSRIGHSLVRPECILALENGRLIATNFDGGVSIIEADGEVWHLLADTDFALKPNGIALLADGSILATQMGASDGGVYRLLPDGRLEPYLLSVDGYDLPPTNFVHRDEKGRVWITVSTRKIPRALGYRRSDGDGFVVLLDGKGARVVADGLGFTNECLIHPDGDHLYVNETFAKRTTKFRIAPDGTLRPVWAFDQFGQAEFPDGMALDDEGELWIACVVANRLVRISESGRRQVVLDGWDTKHTALVEQAYANDAIESAHLARSNGTYGNVSSLAFGGPDLKRIYLGTLLNSDVASFDQDIRGRPPIHWTYGGPERQSTWTATCR